MITCEFDTTTRLLNCSTCKGPKVHNPLEHSARRVDGMGLIAAHWTCGTCRTERHYGFAITECHLCPRETAEEVKAIMRHRWEMRKPGRANHDTSNETAC